jgi:RNA polymerase sigma-70 factor (ECF subfamily)
MTLVRVKGIDAGDIDVGVLSASRAVANAFGRLPERDPPDRLRAAAAAVAGARGAGEAREVRARAVAAPARGEAEAPRALAAAVCREVYLHRGAVIEVSLANAHVVATGPGPEDARLVLALRAGEVGASEAIWARYANRVRRFFARYGGRWLDDIEDLTQDVFLRVFAGHRSIQKPGSLRHFIMSVAFRVLTERIRARRVRRRVCLSATGEVPEVATPAVADDEARHAVRRCYEILARIQTPERTAFMLRHVEEMTMDEIAERLKISKSTAKRLLSRATKKVATRARRALGRADARDAAG